MLPLRLQTTMHKKNLVESCLNTLGTTLHRQISCVILFLRLETTLHKKICSILSQFSWDIIGNTLVQCCPKDFRQYYTRKILLNVALILLGQYYTGKNLVQCCPRGFRQHCPGKNYVQSYLNTPAQCCQRDTTQHCTV